MMLAQGIPVSGSDRQDSNICDRWRPGARVYVATGQTSLVM
jgi:hypothetical protein